MAEVVCGGVIWTSSEFQGGKTATCGPDAASMAEGWARQQYMPLLDVYTRMRAAGRCDANGASTISAIKAQLAADGYRVDSLGFNGALAESAWRPYLLARLPQAAIVIEVANGQALKDALTGQGEDATNLRYHFITLFGHNDGGPSARAGGKTLPAGWWVGDGDSNVLNPIKGGVRTRVIAGHTLCFYPETVLRAAKPVGAVAVYMRTPEGGLAHMSWSKGGDGVYHDGKGHTAGGAVGQALTAKNLLGVDGLTSETYYSSADAFLPLANGAVITAHKGADGQWTTRDDEAAQLLVKFYQQAQTPSPAAVSAPAPATITGPAPEVVEFAKYLKSLEG